MNKNITLTAAAAKAELNRRKGPRPHVPAGPSAQAQLAARTLAPELRSAAGIVVAPKSFTAAPLPLDERGNYVPVYVATPAVKARANKAFAKAVIANPEHPRTAGKAAARKVYLAAAKRAAKA